MKKYEYDITCCITATYDNNKILENAIFKKHEK